LALPGVAVVNDGVKEVGILLVKINADRAIGEFHFSVTNTIEYTSTKKPVGGIGLKNVKRRLELLYNGKYELQIKEDDHLFKVDLKIKF